MNTKWFQSKNRTTFFKSSDLVLILILFVTSSVFAVDNTPQAQIKEPFLPRTESYHFSFQEVDQSPELSALEKLNEFTFKINDSLKNKIYSLTHWGLQSNESSKKYDPYSRKKQFGSWVKQKNKNTCYNVRAQVLIRDSHKPVIFKENNCTVKEGLWIDPYSTKTVTDAQEIQIDHMVPLKEAYISGAYAWDQQTRCMFGNYLGYPFHLLSVYGEENNQKSDKGPQEYLPPNEKYTCTYLKNWLFIKALWNLNLSPDEENQIKNLISKNNCDLKKFKIRRADYVEQSKFYHKNKMICPR